MYYYQLSKAATVSAGANYTKENHLSQMARLNYSYDDRYLATFTVRRDGFSAFGNNNKFGVFPSAALGWNISNEEFFRNSQVREVVNNLKLRVSYGKNGNEAISAYATLPNLETFNYLTDDHGPAYGFYPSSLASPSLSWETTTSFNTGVDFGILNNIITGSFDIYWANTKDLLLYRSIPEINGTNSMLANIGKTANNGYEFQINSRQFNKGDFRWSTTLNWTHYNTKIKDVGLYDENGKPMDDVASGWFIGQPINSNYDYVFDGIWQITDASNPTGAQDPNNPNSIPGYIKYKDLDGNGEINTDDRAVIGRRIPDFTFGIMNNLSYKNVTLSFFINAQFGQTINNNLYTTSHNSYAQNRMMVNFWTPENPTNDYPMNKLDNAVNPYSMSFYEKTDFVRLQDVTLSYRFPERWMSKIGINRLEIFTNLKNLYTWTRWTGLDPEFISSQRAAPQLKSYSFGIKLNF